MEEDIPLDMLNMIKQKKNEICLFNTYAFLLIMTLTKAMGLSTQDSLYFLMSKTGCAFWLIAFLFQKKQLKDWITVVITGAIIGCIYINNSSLVPVMFGMTIVILKDRDIDIVLKRMGMLWLTVTIAGGVLSLVGVIPIEYHGMHNKVKMFYPGPNTFHMSVCIAMAYYYLLHEKTNFIISAMLMFLNTGVFILSRSSGGVIIGYAIIILFSIWRYTKERAKLWQILVKLSGIMTTFLVAFSFIIGILYRADKPVFVKLDRIFTNRVHVMRDIFNAYPITLFGQKLDGRLEYELMDNVFLDVLIEYGIVFFLVFIIMSVLVVRKLYISKKYEMAVLYCIFMVYGVVEKGVRHCFMNFTLLYFSVILWNASCIKEDINSERIANSKKAF